jgi:hypothetical protein
MPVQGMQVLGTQPDLYCSTYSNPYFELAELVDSVTVGRSISLPGD